MTREDIEKSFSYHAAGAALEHYEQKYLQPRISDSMHIVDSFEAGAEWAQEFMIKRACEWLKSNLGNPKEVHPVLVNHLIENFRKAMEE
jgi:hypothetical protein